MMPLSIIEAASEPASGLVSPKQGMSRPSASRGSQRCCCSLVPNRINNSPGPSEFGTLTVAAEGAHDDFLLAMSSRIGERLARRRATLAEIVKIEAAFRIENKAKLIGGRQRQNAAPERRHHRIAEQSGLPCATVYGLFRAL